MYAFSYSEKATEFKQHFDMVNKIQVKNMESAVSAQIYSDACIDTKEYGLLQEHVQKWQLVNLYSLCFFLHLLNIDVDRKEELNAVYFFFNWLTLQRIINHETKLRKSWKFVAGGPVTSRCIGTYNSPKELRKIFLDSGNNCLAS